MTEQDAAAGPILDEVVVTRLRELRTQVQRPGEDLLADLIGLFDRDSEGRLRAMRATATSADRK